MSENRWFDAGRFRGGRGYGLGSGSVIWERRKRNGMWLKTISKRTIRLRSGIRFEINATPHSFKSFRQITPSHRRHTPARRERCIKWERFSARIRSEGPRSQMQDLETGARGELRRRNRNLSRTAGDADFRESSLLAAFFKRCVCRGPSVLSSTRKQRSAFS